MRRMILVAGLLVGLIGTTLPAWAETPPAFEGRRLYVSHCQLCHGIAGDGDGPLAARMGLKPAKLTTTIRSRSDTILRKIISGEGKQTITGRDRHNLLTGSMPEWKEILSDQQIDALIAYMRFLGTSRHGLMGDPNTGQELYQQYCVVCHGEDGGGDGVMTRLLKMKPRDHSSVVAMNALSNESLVRSILQGQGAYMPAWKGILTEQEAEALVSYIRLLTQ